MNKINPKILYVQLYVALTNNMKTNCISIFQVHIVMDKYTITILLINCNKFENKNL